VFDEPGEQFSCHAAAMTMTWPLTAREVAGVPAVPPAALVRVTTNVRAALARAHDAMGLPMQLLLERMLGALDGPALCALVELGVPQHLDRARTAHELAMRVGAHEAGLERLLAYLASRGCVRRDRRGRYRANRVTKLLTPEGGWAGWAQFAGAPWATAAYAQLLTAARDGKDPVVAAHGVDFFSYLAAHPEAAAAFHAAQAAGARLQAVMCADALPTESVVSILDVGGGTGTLLAHVLASHPSLVGAVLDRPDAEAGAQATFAEASLDGRARFEVGDFFKSVPAGYDLHILTAIIHDWGDDECVTILRNCAHALAPGGRICVVETALQPGRRNAFVQAVDALMLALTGGGRERTAAEFDGLWRRAGLQCAKTTPLASGATLFELRVGA
jgi:SAM-dependent methyltransferase